MSVLIGHASSDERGQYKGGKLGEQNGREVYIRLWYNRPWNVMLRPVSNEVAERSAKACEQACGNNNIGYDQDRRTTLFTEALKRNWQINQITTPCATDCSALQAVCANAAGVKVSKDIYTGNMVKTLVATGQYVAHYEEKYLEMDGYLMRGDILVYENHHTAMVLSDGEKNVRYKAGWNQDKNGWFFATSGTECYRNCWQIINHHKYWFNKDGYAVTDWNRIDGKWYYFEPGADHPLCCAMYESDPGDRGSMIIAEF